MQGIVLIGMWMAGVLLITSSMYITHIWKQRHEVEALSSFPAAPSLTIYSTIENIQSETQMLAVSSWLNLQPPPCVVLIGFHPSVFAFVQTLHHAHHCISIESDVDFTMVARARATINSEVAVMIESDLILLPTFIDVISHIHTQLTKTNDWLVVASDSNIPQVWAWNTGPVPLHAGVLPPFVYNKHYHSQWLLTEALFSAVRLVVDITNSTIFRTGAAVNPERKSDSDWEVGGNSKLAVTYGSYGFRTLNISDAPLKLVHCRSSSSEYCLLPQRRSSSRTHGRNSAAAGDVDADVTREDSNHLEWLLLTITNSSEKLVILTVVSNSYREMMMSWVCRLRHLNISNYLVGAIDDEIFEYSRLQGVPVFRVDVSAPQVNSEDCIFGTKCFSKITKLKSRTVVRILKLGYHVLFSDVDVYWFSNPIQRLKSFGSNTLPAQSDTYNETEALNVPKRLNSGFYFARSENSTIKAFEKIVEHAARSKWSEQPSFYDVLCGDGGKYRVGYDMCRSDELNVTVKLLDRLKFPNGAYRKIWESDDVKQKCMEYGCVILHNNWKTGIESKIQRQISARLWEYDIESRMCIKNWQTINSVHFY